MVNTSNIERGNSSAPIDSDALLTSLNGGLNTIAGDLNLNRGDTPLCYNVDITDSGHVKSRDGTQTVVRYASSIDEGSIVVPYTTKSGVPLLFQKVNTGLYVFFLRAVGDKDVRNYGSQYLTFLNVWASYAASLKPDFVITNELAPRLIFTLGNHVPIQFQIIEADIVVTEASSFNTIDFDSVLYEHATTGQLLLINTSDSNDDNVYVDISSVSYSAGTLTVTTTQSFDAGTYNLTLIFITWQWICQGILLSGSDVYQSVTRFHSDRTDVSVPVPTDLIRNTSQIANTNRYPIIPYKSSTRGDYYTIDSDASPALWNEFAFSSGIVYSESANSDRVPPGISHITFGDVRDTDTGNDPDLPEEVHFIKAIRLDFDDDADSFTADVTVVVDTQVATEVNSGNLATNTTDWGESYVIRSNVTDTTLWSNSSVAANGAAYKYITFDGSVDVGVAATATIEIIYPADNNFNGSGSVAAWDAKPRVGYAVPWYGIQEHASYVLGSFPRTVELVEGRLALGGFPTDQLKIVLSDVRGTSPLGRDFYNYSIANNDLSAFNPMQVLISSNENDARITALGVAAGNLIAFTERTCFRVYGGSAALSPTNSFVSLVARTGCVNSNALVGIENSIVFLSLGGLFRIAPSIEIGDFSVSILSSKVNTQMKSRNNIQCGWVAYDPSANKILVGVTQDDDSVIATECYIYSTVRDAWTTYRTINGYWMCSTAAYIEVDNKPFTFFFMGWDANNTDLQDSMLVSYPWNRQLDFGLNVNIDNTTDWASLVSSRFNSYPQVVSSFSPTTDFNLNFILLDDFRASKFVNHKDVKALIDGNPLVFGETFFKSSEFNYSIGTTISTGQTLQLHPINEDDAYPIEVYRNNIKVPYDELTITLDDTVAGVTDLATVDFVSAPDANDRIFIGLSIPKMYVTPIQVRGEITGRKQSLDAFLLLRNVDFHDRYFTTDLNTDVSQAPNQLVGVWKKEVNINVAKVVSPGEISELLLSTSVAENAAGSNSLMFDFSSFDADASGDQTDDYTRVGVNVRGSQEIMQFYFYEYGSKVFELIAYQITSNKYGRGTL